MDDSTVLEELLAPLRAEFHARRRTALTQTDALVQAIEHYRRAIEVDVARQLAESHGLRHLREKSDAKEAARMLLRVVQALPELAQTPQAPLSPAVAQPAPPAARAVRDSADTDPRWRSLEQAVARGPLVIVGGAPHPDRLRQLPGAIVKTLEWVDTRQKGTHAIGNLERRIREHRITALILLEGLVQHRHTDPLVSAARAADVPHAYAGKGGTLALATALGELEAALSPTIA